MIFENYIIQAPDGVILSRCGFRKKEWYVSRDLAEEINEKTIRLKFEPSGRDGIGDPLLEEGKPNICVVCGVDKNLTKHHIVPYSFIKHMPLEYRLAVIHDILPVCRKHHRAYEKISNIKRDQLAKEYGVVKDSMNEVDEKKSKAIKAASAICKYGEKIPDHRKEELKEIVKNYLQIENDPTLQQLESLNWKNFKVNTVTRSVQIIEKCDDFEEFAREWRRHFIETMNPKHMPEKWSVDRGFKANWIPDRFKEQEKNL